MKILENYKVQNMSTSSVEDFLVKMSVLQAKVLELKAIEAGYTLKCLELYGKLDLNMSLLKIAQCSLFEDSSKSYAIFPKSGIMQNGNVYRVPTLAFNRVGKDYIVLPTIVKSSAKGASKNRYFGSPTYRGNLHEFIRDGEQDGIYPHPELLEKLMTYPIHWTELDH